MDIEYLLLSHGIGSNENEDATVHSPISNFTAILKNSSIQLSWINPNEAGFAGIRIQRKLGSYPTSISDGITVFEGVAITYLDNSISEDGTYYYRAFTYGSGNKINDDISQQVSINVIIPKVYTVIIDTNNSNPLSSVTYADNAVGIEPGSTAWDSIFPFNEIKPVMLKNGIVSYYLNPNNFNQKIDGSAADITSGNDGDVMIQFPRFYNYIRKVENLIYVSISKEKVNENFECLAHTKSGVQKDYTYVGAYIGTMISSKMRSISGGNGTKGGTRNTIRTAAQNNGTGYQLLSYYQMVMIQVLYLVKYKNLNSQDAIGLGSINDDGTIPPIGSLNTNGMSFGNKSTTGSSVKLFGIENLWGAHYEIIDGIMTDSNNNIFTATDNFNNDRIGYTNHGASSFAAIYVWGYMKNVVGSNSLGFFPTEAHSSSSTYFCDVGSVVANGTYITGGVWEGLVSGLFNISFWDDYDSQPFTSGRIAYL